MKSKLATYSTKMSPNYNKRTEKISKITIHHMAGSLTANQCAAIFANPARCASANYIIGRDGEIECNVEEENRAWTSSSKWNDHRAITIEVANSTGYPTWEISDKVMKSLINLCIDICQRYDIKPNFTSTKNGTFTFHCMYTNTECPGPYIKNKIAYIIEEINSGLQAGSSAAEPVAPPSDGFLVKVTAKSLNIRKGPGSKFAIVGKITDQGIYTIVATANGWGRLKSGAGWISLKYTKEVE